MSHDQNEEKPLVQCNYSCDTILIMQGAEHNFKGFIQIENLWVLPFVQVLRWGAIEDLQNSYRKTLIKSL
jgi:hypothetical protein